MDCDKKLGCVNWPAKGWIKKKIRAIGEKPRYTIGVTITLEFSKFSASGLRQQTQPTKFGLEIQGM